MSLNDMQKNVLEASAVYGNGVDLIKNFSEKVALVEKIASIPPDQQQVFHHRMAMVNLAILFAHKIQSAIDVAKSSTSDYPPWEHPDWHDYFESLLYGLYKANLTLENGKDLEFLRKAKNFNDKLIDPQVKLNFLRNIDLNKFSKQLVFSLAALFGVSFSSNSDAELAELMKEFITETIVGLEDEITQLLKLQKDLLHA
jgi:hypothetical protein